MKNILMFLVFVLFVSLSTNSQDYIRIGRGKNEILNEFKIYKPLSAYEMVKININGDDVIYIFDEYNYCDKITIIAKDYETENEYKLFFESKSFKKNNITEIGKYKIHYNYFSNIDNNTAFVFTRTK